MMTAIVLSGSIGAGKSSLTSLLAEYLGTQAFYEGVDNNPTLSFYYKDMVHYTFLLSTHLLSHRLAQTNQAICDHSSVPDRSTHEDALLFKMNVDSGIADSAEFKVYDSLPENTMEQAPGNPSKKLDLLTYIHVSFDTMLHCIQKCGRTLEQLSTDPGLKDYYARLLSYYEPWYEKYNASPKIMIDGDKHDFVVDEDARKEVINTISQKLTDLGNLS